MDKASVNERVAAVKRALLSMQRYNWEQGVAAQAMLELGDVDETIALAYSAVYRQEEGRFSVMGQYSPTTDAASVGEAVLFAAEHTGDPRLVQGVDDMIKVIRTTPHRSADGTLYHTCEPTRSIMSDAFYMLPPFLAAAGEIDLTLGQIEGFHRALWHPKERLYSHIWDDEKGEFKREAFWGVGNGWTAAGLARVIGHLPAERGDDRDRLVGQVTDLLEGCLQHLRSDGLFHNEVDDESTFPEVNLSQMIAYTIYRGVRAGWLDDRYLAYAHRMRRAAHDRVDPYGFVHEVCGIPHFDRPFVAPEGQAFFLLMEAAVRDLEAAR